VTQYLGAVGLILVGVILGISLTTYMRSLRRRIIEACRPTKGRALRLWLCSEDKGRIERTDISAHEHHRRAKKQA